ILRVHHQHAVGAGKNTDHASLPFERVEIVGDLRRFDFDVRKVVVLPIGKNHGESRRRHCGKMTSQEHGSHVVALLCLSLAVGSCCESLLWENPARIIPQFFDRQPGRLAGRPSPSENMETCAPDNTPAMRSKLCLLKPQSLKDIRPSVSMMKIAGTNSTS